MSFFAAPIEIFGWIVVGIIVAHCVFNFSIFFYTSWLGSLLGFNIDLRKCGPWAVVTGATDGLGKSFAKKLAEVGLNVVLISRSPSKLETVADEIQKVSPTVQIKTIAVDFTEGQSIYPKLRDELNSLEIGILFNNVGMLPHFGRTFHTMRETDVHDVVNCNMMSLARMCHIVLPQLVERKKGIIVNIGSLSSSAPTPLLTLYGSTKAFLEKFSRDLAVEVKPLGVKVLTVHPGFIDTKMVNLGGPTLFTPSADVVAGSILRTLGLEERSAGYWSHKIQLFCSDWGNWHIPRFILAPFGQWNVEQKLLQQLKMTKSSNDV